MRLIAICLLSLAGSFFQEKIDDKVRPLLEKLQEDDISVSDQAATELVLLGSPALALLREQALKGTGDFKVKLESIIRKIERQEKLAKVCGKAPIVTIHAKNLPLAEVLADLAKQSGVPIESKDVPAGTKVTLGGDKILLWKAVELLCQGHGQLMYSYGPKRIVIRPGTFRKLPTATEGSSMFLVDRLSLSHYLSEAGGSDSFEITGALILPPGLRPYHAALQVEALEDDKGTNLMANPGGGGGMMFIADYGSEQTPDSMVLPLNQYPEVQPHADATSLATFKGRVVMKVALEWNKLLSIKDPIAQATTEAKSQDKNNKTSTMQIRKWTKDGQRIQLAVHLTRHFEGDMEEAESEEGSTRARVVAHDAKGNPLQAAIQNQGTSMSSSGTEMTSSEDLTLTIVLPEGATLGSLDLMEPTEIEELTIPFDFKGLPLR